MTDKEKCVMFMVLFIIACNTTVALSAKIFWGVMAAGMWLYFSMLFICTEDD